MSDAVRDVDLERRELLEASAGTGKTYALAGLFARAVIVERLRVPQILAVTYTIAATQELHARVRLRLQQAAELAMAWREGDPPRRADDSPEIALLRELIHAALHPAGKEGEPLPALRLRLGRAVRDMDLAAIATIHGFCQRLLAEHALDAGERLVANELQPDNRASRMALAVELWRAFSVDAADSDFLRRAFGDIGKLTEAIVPLLSFEPLLPEAPAVLPDDPRPQSDAAWQRLRAAFAAHGEQARGAVSAAIDAKLLHSGQYKAEHVEGLWTWLADRVRHAAAPEGAHEKCGKYTPAALAAGTLKASKGRTPQSPLFEAMEAWMEAQQRVPAWREAADLQRLHALRAEAKARDAARKAAFNVRGFDDLVDAVYRALAAPESRDRLVAALHAQYPLVLVDEFQDTDARQWAIFDAISRGGGLVLVGDPKQAIYRFRGGDVHAYLRARADVDESARLERNFRSRRGVVDTVNALFAGLPAGEMGAGIGYAPVEAAKGDDGLSIDGEAAPAFVYRALPPVADESGAFRDRDAAETMAAGAAACAQAIRDWLQLAADGRAQRRDGERWRPLEARDCAVLVRRHSEAQAVRDALARLGVPAVATGNQSLVSGDAAQTLLTLLLALAAPGDERRLRAALALFLFGLDAAQLRALDDDGDALRRWQTRFEHWRLRWQQHGPQAMLTDVAAQQAETVLAFAEGERRLTHLLQLGETMQEANAAQLGPHSQIDWLRAAIDRADDKDEAQWPRLESDASRVQILTLHKSKGLEFPLVFLPFAGVGLNASSKSGFIASHDDKGERVRQWKTDDAHGALPWKQANGRAQQEESEEDMRLLYVGLTRAIDFLWTCGGAVFANSKSALCRLLGGALPSAFLRQELGDRLYVDDRPLDPEDARRLRAAAAAPTPPPRAPLGPLRRDWWIHSFSQLHRQRPHGVAALVEETPAGDERSSADWPLAVRAFSGERFGNALHYALEHADFAAWRDAQDVPDGETDLLRRALRSQGYREDQDDDGIAELAPLVRATLQAPLSAGDLGFRLCDLPPAQRIAELEFHFALDDADGAALLALLHAHGLASDRRDFGVWPRLNGLMNGKIDLIVRVDGRAFVIDYKSNYLPDSDEASLQRAMAAHEYDLQALLYAVAVHRWLRLRLGGEYRFERHFGGVRYLFCRGLDPRNPQRGVITPALPRELIEGADGLLSNGRRE